MSKAETYDSVWDAISDTPFEAASMRARSELMRKIADYIKTKEWTQSEVAHHAGVTQPRINDLLRGRISNFSIDALVDIATSLGLQIHIDVDAA